MTFDEALTIVVDAATSHAAVDTTKNLPDLRRAVQILSNYQALRLADGLCDAGDRALHAWLTAADNGRRQ